MRKLLPMMILMFLISMFSGCSNMGTIKGESGKKKVGLALPTKSSQRWGDDGNNIKKELEALGYEVDMQYAEDIIENQVSQIENMI